MTLPLAVIGAIWALTDTPLGGVFSWTLAEIA